MVPRLKSLSRWSTRKKWTSVMSASEFDARGAVVDSPNDFISRNRYRSPQLSFAEPTSHIERMIDREAQTSDLIVVFKFHEIKILPEGDRGAVKLETRKRRDCRDLRVIALQVRLKFFENAFKFRFVKPEGLEFVSQLPEHAVR